MRRSCVRNSPPWPPRWAHLTPEQLAEGFIQIAVANMAQAIRQISVQKGLNPADFALVCFGGAGGQHACAVADELGMDRVFIHPLAGVLSAYGIGLSDFSLLREQAVELPFTPQAIKALAQTAARLAAEAEAALRAQNPGAAITHTATILLRYAGTDTALPVELCEFNEMARKFTAAHQRLFGFVTPGKATGGRDRAGGSQHPRRDAHRTRDRRQPAPRAAWKPPGCSPTARRMTPRFTTARPSARAPISPARRS